MLSCRIVELGSNLKLLGEAILKKTGKFWEKFPKGGWIEKQTEIPNFNLGIVKTQGEGLDFSKMSEL